ETAFRQVQQGAGYLVRFTKGEIERRVDMRRRELLEFLQCLDPALGLARLGGLGLEAADEAFHVRTLRLLLLERLLLLCQPLGPSALERRVAPSVQGQLALLEMHDVIDHRIEEVTVMGNKD